MKNNFKNGVLSFALLVLIYQIFSLNFLTGKMMFSEASTFSWEETQLENDYLDIQNISDVSGNSDGTNLIATRNGGHIYLSQDGGISWVERKPAGDEELSWGASAVSEDGTHFLAGVLGGRLYLSTDSGSNWAETGPSIGTNKNWYSAAMNFDGSIIVVSEGWGVGRLYLSTDGGG